MLWSAGPWKGLVRWEDQFVVGMSLVFENLCKYLCLCVWASWYVSSEISCSVYSLGRRTCSIAFDVHTYRTWVFRWNNCHGLLSLSLFVESIMNVWGQPRTLEMHPYVYEGMRLPSRNLFTQERYIIFTMYTKSDHVGEETACQ